VMILVIFDDFVFGKMVFPLVDYIKLKLSNAIENVYEKEGIRSKFAKLIRKYFLQWFATVMIILYCYIGYEILGAYVIEPILQRWKAIILIVIIVLFLLLNYIVNNARMRKRFFGFTMSNPKGKKSTL